MITPPTYLDYWLLVVTLAVLYTHDIQAFF